MQVVHFTVGSTDPIEGFCAHGVRAMPLADGAGVHETFVSCLHLEPGAWVADPPAMRDSALLVVSGEVSFIGSRPTGVRLELSGGVGLTLSADEHYRLESNTGAIILVVEAERLEPTREGLSTPTGVGNQGFVRTGVTGPLMAHQGTPFRVSASVTQSIDEQCESSGGLSSAGVIQMIARVRLAPVFQYSLET